MQIYGIGTDLVAVARMSKLWQRYKFNIATKILTKPEQQELANSTNKQVFLAKRFAAKEAIAKALGTGFGQGVLINQIGVSHTTLGKPEVQFFDSTLQYVNSLGKLQFQLSIADEKSYVVAFAIASLLG